MAEQLPPGVRRVDGVLHYSAAWLDGAADPDGATCIRCGGEVPDELAGDTCGTCDDLALECECGAGPFSDEDAVELHRRRWHPAGLAPVLVEYVRAADELVVRRVLVLPDRAPLDLETDAAGGYFRAYCLTASRPKAVRLVL